MPVPTDITDLNSSAASNSPQGSEAPWLGDDYLRALSAFIRQVYDLLEIIRGVITVSGTRVGINQATPAVTLDVTEASSGRAYARLTPSTGTQSTLWRSVNTGGDFYTGVDDSTGSLYGTAYASVLWNAGARDILFGTNATYRGRFTYNGHFLHNTDGTSGTNLGGFTSETYAGGVKVTVGHNGSAADGDAYVQFLRSGATLGSITQVSTTGVLFNTTSDRRLKTNVRPFQFNAGHVLRNTVPCSYDWKSTGETGHGYLAQQLNRFYPPAVTKGTGKGKNATPWQVDFSKIVPLLHVRLVEMEGEIKALRAELKAKG